MKIRVCAALVLEFFKGTPGSEKQYLLAYILTRLKGNHYVTMITTKVVPSGRGLSIALMWIGSTEICSNCHVLASWAGSASYSLVLVFLRGIAANATSSIF